jgi:hypothetical protein
MSFYHHKCFEFKSHSWQGVLVATLCDKVCQWLGAGQWFSLVNPGFSSTNETDHHDITEILLKVELNTNNPTKSYNNQNCFMYAFYECQIEVDSLETPTVTVKYRIAIKALFLSLICVLSVKLNSLSCSFIFNILFY